MIRQTRHVPLFGQCLDPGVIERIALPERLTTARFEPIVRYHYGYGQVDLLFENADESWVLAGLFVDGIQLLARAQSPLVWPAAIASNVDHARLTTIELEILPWLRSRARARPMAEELIRRFQPSKRFDRARAANLPGAAPLARTVVEMAPFVFARRFASGRRVRLTCTSAFLGWAMLSDVASAVECREPWNDAERFVRDWFSLPHATAPAAEEPEVIIGDRDDEPGGSIVIALRGTPPGESAIIDIPEPTPWDVMFPFDRADAPSARQFSVSVVEPLLRPQRRTLPDPDFGTSGGAIVFALGVEALATGGGDVEEVRTLQALLVRAGFSAVVVSNINDPAIRVADVMHIIGAPYDEHVTQFAMAARERFIPYVFDLAPTTAKASGYLENALPIALRSCVDDAGLDRYLSANEARNINVPYPGEMTPEEFVQRQQVFSGFADDAMAILTAEAEISLAANARVVLRGAFLEAEPAPARIGHLIPRAPFAFVHDSIGLRSHALFAAMALEQAGIPLVIAGPLCDVDYLALLRLAAPSAVILVDADPASIAAIYRCAAVWIDAAPRPSSVSRLVRAVGCGAFPVVPAESPLARIAGETTPTFSLASFHECAHVVAAALAAGDNERRMEALRLRLEPLFERGRSFRAVMEAYRPAAVSA